MQMIRKRCRTQCSWNLHLAGDFHPNVEDKPLGSRPHMMRCMLTSNLAVDERFANGTATCLHCNYIPAPTFETYWSANNVAVWSRYTGPAHGMASGRDGEQAQSSSGTRQTITRIGGASPVLFFPCSLLLPRRTTTTCWLDFAKSPLCRRVRCAPISITST